MTSAIYTDDGVTEAVSSGIISTSTTGEYGIYVTGGGNLTLLAEVIETAGSAGDGFYADDASSATLTGFTISTTGSAAHGVYATGAGTEIILNGGTIDVSGAGSHGVYVFSTAVVIMSGTVVSTTGSATAGAIETDMGGGTITATDVVASTIGARSPDTFAAGANTYVTVTSSILTAAENEVATDDAGGHTVLNYDDSTGSAGAKMMMTVPGITTADSVVVNGGSVTATDGDGFDVDGEVNALSGSVTIENGATVTESTGILLDVTSSSVGLLTASDVTLSGDLETDSTSTISASLVSSATLTGAVNSAAMTIDDTSTLKINGGSVITTLANSGTLDVLSGRLEITGATTGSGEIAVASGATLEISASVASTQEIALVEGAVISVTGETVSGFSYDSSTHILAISAGGAVHDLSLTGGYVADDFSVVSGGLEMIGDTACYGGGTMIATPGGGVAIEDMAIGDLVVTAAAPAGRPVRWIGMRAFDGRFIAGNRNLLPIQIRAGALAEGVPARDLLVSPLHALFLEGALIPAWVLANGLSIRQLEAVESVAYFHLEFDRHEIIFAENAAAESFVDDHGREMFQNAASYHALYPDALPQKAVYCAARLEAGELVEQVRARLEERAVRLGFTPALEMAPQISVVSLPIPAGVTGLALGRSGLISLTLDGVRLTPDELAWDANGSIELGASSTDRWCHIERAA